MKRLALLAAAVATVALMGSAAQADVTVYNTAPNDPYDYGNGNNYFPSNSAVFTATNGDQIALRAHETFQTALPSVGNDYNFSLGAGKQISFDWLIDTTGSGGFDGVSSLFTLTSARTGGSFSWDVLLTPDNRPVANDSLSNSFRANWFSVPLGGFDTTLDDTLNGELKVFGLAGGTKSLNIDVILGEGVSAVPEPATWAMMITGFGLAGASIRSRRRVLATA